MADFTVVGFIRNVKYLDNSCVVFIDEFRKGYVASSGRVVEDTYYQWSCLFGEYFKKYITSHFSNGMLVQIKGDIKPFSIENDEFVRGYSVIGQTINLASYPNASLKREIRMRKDSQTGMDGASPDLDGYMRSDF